MGNNQENWRDIPGYENIYQVSDLGRIKRLAGSPKCNKDRIVKRQFSSNGYLQVSLSKDSKVRIVGIHRLVMLAFVGESNGFWVNHKNGIKSDNRLENLEYTTPSDNTKHGYDSGLNSGAVGELNGQTIMTDDLVYQVRLAFALCGDELNRKDVCGLLGISKTALSDILANRSWTHIK